MQVTDATTPAEETLCIVRTSFPCFSLLFPPTVGHGIVRQVPLLAFRKRPEFADRVSSNATVRCGALINELVT